MVVRGDELLFKSLFLKANTTLSATIILFLFSFTIFFQSPSYGGSSTLYSLLLDHLDCTLVNHLNFHSSICLIKHFLWLFVSSGGWKGTVQESSPHKCGQKGCCSAFNAVVTASFLDISVFLSSSYVLEIHPYR